MDDDLIPPSLSRGKITFQPTITFGNVLSLLVIVSGGMGVFFGLRADVAGVLKDVSAIDRRMDGMVGRPEFEARVGSLEGTVRVQGYRIDRVVEGRLPAIGPGHQ